MTDDQLTFETGEATGIIPEGPNRGTIESVELDDSSGYEYVRINIQTDTDVEMSVSYPAPDDKLTQNHGLGEAVVRFGTELDGEVNLASVFESGTEVEFEAYEDDETGYMEIDEGTFRPAGQEGPETDEEDSQDEQDMELSEQLEDVLDGQKGKNKNAVIGEIAGKLGGDFVEEFNNAVEAGVVKLDGNDNYQGVN